MKNRTVILEWFQQIRTQKVPVQGPIICQKPV